MPVSVHREDDVAHGIESGASDAVSVTGGRHYAALTVLAVSVAIGSTGLAAGGTAGTLLGDQIAGPGASGLPPAVLIVGYAGGALFISRQADRGRRGRGLVLGYVLGMTGAAVVIAAAVTRSLPALVAGSAVLGVANAAIYLTRYAATASAAGRGRAIGTVFFATAVGAVLSSLLLGPSGKLASAVGLPPLTGLYLIAITAFGLSVLLLSAASLPSTPWAGRAHAVLVQNLRPTSASVTERRRSLATRRAGAAFAALGVTNMIMVGTMVVAPVRMMDSGDALPMIGSIVALHVAGMFAPSPVSGMMADQLGPWTVVLCSAGLYIADNVVAAFTGVNSTDVMVGYLIVVGVAWNCGVVGGSALLVSAVPDVSRSYAEGMGEVAMGVAAAAAAPIAGLIAARAGFSVYALYCAALAFGMVCVFACAGPSLFRHAVTRRR